jgi:hypothetical protein
VAARDDPISILHAVATTLNQVPDVMDAMARILPRLTEALEFHTGWMFLLASDQATVAGISYTGLPPALAARRAWALRDGTCHCQDTFRQGELTRAVNIVRCSRLQNAAGDRGGLVFHASVPLRSKGRRLGILNVASPGRELFGPDVLKVLSAVGQQVAVAIERSRLYRQAERRVALLGVLEQAVGRLAGLHDRQALADEAVQTLTRMFACRSAVLFEWTAPAWRPLARSGRPIKGSPPPVPDAVADWGAHEMGWVWQDRADTHLMAVPGDARTPLVLAVSGIGDDEGILPVLHSYAGHLGLALVNAALMAQRQELGAWEERRRLARELHDAVSQRLFSASLALAAAREQVDAESPAVPLLHQAQEHTGAALREMKQLVYELRPPAVAPLGAALVELARSAGSRVTVGIDANPAIPETLRLSFLRIAQEALQNALRHAPLAPVTILLTTDPARSDALVLQVRDQGPGFDPATTPRGLGLHHMEERAHAVGAELILESAPGHGTTVQVTAPGPSATRPS